MANAVGKSPSRADMRASVRLVDAIGASAARAATRSTASRRSRDVWSVISSSQTASSDRKTRAACRNAVGSELLDYRCQGIEHAPALVLRAGAAQIDDRKGGPCRPERPTAGVAACAGARRAAGEVVPVALGEVGEEGRDHQVEDRDVACAAYGIIRRGAIHRRGANDRVVAGSVRRRGPVIDHFRDVRPRCTPQRTPRDTPTDH